MAKERFDYFDALITQGEYAVKEAQMLIEIVKDFDPEKLLEQCAAVHDIENAADKQTHLLFTHIATEFLTPIDREDIAEVALRLDDIVDYIDDVAHLLYMYVIQEIHPPTIEMAEIINKATDALVEVLREFRNFKKSKTLADYLIVVNDLEEEADRLYACTIRNLYLNHTADPIFVMAWSNIFQYMERCIDACENVADRISTIALKNS